MLASVHDADGALQDTLLRAWRGLPRFEGRSSLRSWLYRIATNARLDRIAQRPKRGRPPRPVGAPGPTSVVELRRPAVPGGDRDEGADGADEGLGHRHRG